MKSKTISELKEELKEELKTISTKIEMQRYLELKSWAKKEGRSISAQVAYVLEGLLQNRKLGK